MDTALTVTSILAVLAVGVVSPGPSFILVARAAVACSRTSAMASAIGMASGATIWSLAALLGLHALFVHIPAVYLGMKIVGGLYLVFLAVKTWRGAATPIEVDVAVGQSSAGRLRHFWLAAVTMLSNPKAAVQYGVLFAAMIPSAPSASLLVVLPVAVFVLEATWYLVVALVLSAPRPRNAYLRMKTHIDRTVGVMLGLLGVRLVLSSN